MSISKWVYLHTPSISLLFLRLLQSEVDLHKSLRVSQGSHLLPTTDSQWRPECLLQLRQRWALLLDRKPTRAICFIIRGKWIVTKGVSFYFDFRRLYTMFKRCLYDDQFFCSTNISTQNMYHRGLDGENTEIKWSNTLYITSAHRATLNSLFKILYICYNESIN